MRLINAHTLELSRFVEDRHRPSYAILSHTWGDGEMEFQDMMAPVRPNKAGYAKILKCCRQAVLGGYDWVWVDTCCIDKSSSAELSEAINSMYRWYKESAVCYAFLADVDGTDDLDDQSFRHRFAASRWFMRGWTLQELLAPRYLDFFSATWTFLGSRDHLCHQVSDTARINVDYILRPGNIYKASAAERMSWVSRRQTTRPEDIAYCLLGIFDITMPLIYGEGHKAFIRLQEHIMRRAPDVSLFAWGQSEPCSEANICCSAENEDTETRGAALPQLSSAALRETQLAPHPLLHGFLAPSPKLFKDSSAIVQWDDGHTDPPAVDADIGIRITAPICGAAGRRDSRDRDVAITLMMVSTDISPCILLRCRDRDDQSSVIAIPIVRRSQLSLKRQRGRAPPASSFSGHEPYYRIGCGPPLRIPLAYFIYGTPTTINVAKHSMKLTRDFGPAVERVGNTSYDVALMLSPELAEYKLCDDSEEPWPIESGNRLWKHTILATGAIADLYVTAPHRQAGLYPSGAGALRFRSKKNKDRSLVVVLRATYAAPWERSIIRFLKRFPLQFRDFHLEASAFLVSRDDCPQSVHSALNHPAIVDKDRAAKQPRSSIVRCALDTTSGGCLGAYNVRISLGTPEDRNSMFHAGWRRRTIALTPDHASMVFRPVLLVVLAMTWNAKSIFQLQLRGFEAIEQVPRGQLVVLILTLALCLYAVRICVQIFTFPWAPGFEIPVHIMD